ncbi:hypothetical protein [Bradyrhizobium sp. dw_411]|uniref:hypothetical protein n=1 Tax=Bradyrhizobium sp. dw_411 TaxID=2720082 RepID=UPI001BCC9094|nr:hypothetical protein [Bradyrhizobium sp. dw_411]
MTDVAQLRAPAIAEKLEAARALLAAHSGEVAQTVLDAVENVPGALKRLTDLRTRISTGELAVAELEKAYDLAGQIDRQASVAAATKMRGEQLVAFRKEFEARQTAMAAVLKAAAAMASAYGEYSEATLRAAAVIPSGTTVPPIAIGGEGMYGAAFGPCERLILAELYRLAPERADGIGRFVLPFAKPPSERFRGNHPAIPAGIEELRAADAAILADVSQQIENLNEAAMRFALAPERKDAA